MIPKLNLQQIKIASPCHVGWHNMHGDDKVRFCESCQKHVYNFSEMTLEEGSALILATEGNLCGHLSRRDDGTIITKDCPVGFANKIYRRCLYAILTACMLILSMMWIRSRPGGESPLVDRLQGWIESMLNWIGGRSSSRTFSTMDGFISYMPSTGSTPSPLSGSSSNCPK
ncbi:MAG: hypothetical protein QM703_00660 [Gemmatales bacterium]